MIINTANLAAAFTGFKVIFSAAFENAPVTWDAISTVIPSSTKQELYPWLGRTTKFREWLGDRAIQALEAHSFAIVNKHFENTVAINRDEFGDDTYGIYAPIIAQLGMDSKVHPDQLVWSLVKAGQTGLCYDGQPFFSVSHPSFDPLGNPITVANLDNGGTGPFWYLFDTTRMIKPVIFQKRKEYQLIPITQLDAPEVFNRNEFVYGVDARVNVGYGLWQFAYASNEPLDTAHYAAARAAMMSIRMENGDYMGVTPSTLVVPPSLEGAARTLIHADIILQTTNIWKSSANLVVAPRVA